MTEKSIFSRSSESVCVKFPVLLLTGIGISFASLGVNASPIKDSAYFRNKIGAKTQSLEEAIRNRPIGYASTQAQKSKDLWLQIRSRESKSGKLLSGQLPIEVVTGKVLDSTNSPVIGAYVYVNGGKNSTTTDENGVFILRNVADTAEIIIQAQGFISQMVQASDQNLLVVLHPAQETGLDDVVVTGFMTASKKRFTGAATKLKMDDIELQGMPDASRMLEGRAPGVSVQNVSGTFGSAPKVRVRGVTSLTGDNKPLWVVDGVVQEDVVDISSDQLSSGDPTTLLGSSIAGLNANDIESFDILKDAAATAMYGARAMNGVIVITTKKGVKGAPRINYNGNYSTQLKPNYSTFNIMNSADQMAVYNEMQSMGLLNYVNMANASDYGIFGKMANQINDYNATSGQFGLPNTTAARNQFLSRYASANTDWFDLLFRNNFMQEHSISISSGTDKSQSYASISYYGDNGWTIADKVKRYTMNFRNNYNLSDKFSIGFQTIGSYRKQYAPGANDRQSDPVNGTFSRDFDINPFSYAMNTSRTITPYNEDGSLEYFQRNYAPFNIINELANNYLAIDVMDVKLQANAAWKINKHFRYEFLGAMRYVKSLQERMITENSNMANAYRAAGNSTIRANNKFLYHDPDYPDAEGVVVLPYGGFYNRTEDAMKNYDFRNTLYYNQNFKKHNISAFVGQQTKLTDRQQFSNTGYGYQYDEGGIPAIDYKIIKQTIEANFPYYSNSYTWDRFAAFYGHAEYSYNSKYNISFDGRYDGSNKMGKSNTARWLPTGTIAAGWVISDENLFKEKVSWVSFLKLRASYGLTASMGNATNSQIVLQNQITNRPYTDEKETVLNINHLENSDLTWEKNKQFDIGLDGALFDNRLTFTMDYYDRRGYDLINSIKTSGIGGEQWKEGNVADLSSHGFEFQLGGTPIRTKDFKWISTFNFSYNTSKVTRADNTPIIWQLVQPEGYFKKGYPVRSLFSIDYKDLDPVTGVPNFVSEDGVVGHSVYLQSDSTNHLKYEGPVDATIFGGWNNSFTYKNLTLNLYFTYAAGNKIRLTPAFSSGYNDWSAMPKEFYDRFVMTGDQNSTNIPSIPDNVTTAQLGGDNPYYYYNYSSARVAKGDFIRLKSVSLSYMLPEKFIQRYGFKSASVMTSGYNLWLMYSDKKLKGQDPEFFNTGGVAQPIQKQYTFTLRLGL